MLVAGDAGGMLAVEKALQPLSKIVEAGGVGGAAHQGAPVAIGGIGLLETEQSGHVVIRGFPRSLCARRGLTVGFLWIAVGDVAQKAGHVPEEVAGHHRGRNRRVADDLAGQHLGIGRAEEGVELGQIIHCVDIAVADSGGDLHLEGLVGVQRVKKSGRIGSLRLRQLQPGDVAHDGLALVAEGFGTRGADDA